MGMHAQLINVNVTRIFTSRTSTSTSDRPSGGIIAKYDNTECVCAWGEGGREREGERCYNIHHMLCAMVIIPTGRQRFGRACTI